MPLVTPVNLIAKTEDGDRYVHPETGEILPRVTSVIKGFSPHHSGFTGAMQAGAARGTALHNAIEAALLGRSDAAVPVDVLPFWNQIVPLLERIGELSLIESPVWLKEGAAGTPDCGGVYGGALTLFDWKTCKYATPTVWQRDYPLQVAAYVKGAENTYGLKFPQAVIAIASPHNLRLVELDADAIEAAWEKFKARLDLYKTRQEAWLNQLENSQESHEGQLSQAS